MSEPHVSPSGRTRRYDGCLCGVDELVFREPGSDLLDARHLPAPAAAPTMLPSKVRSFLEVRSYGHLTLPEGRESGQIGSSRVRARLDLLPQVEG